MAEGTHAHLLATEPRYAAVLAQVRDDDGSGATTDAGPDAGSDTVAGPGAVVGE